ncbi:MAG: hypothetical protein A3G71_01300 [Gammaproteobacteria bacterium RIFCSPLOWO2_12_FULL_38_14]|nr:MAG: hypothetical protein A3G71_01300 [Gammaproteobacteria bacterium RIFCSPLOWO2_12_FULL_38_14]
MPPNKEDIFKKIKNETVERLTRQIKNLSSETDELTSRKKEKLNAILDETKHILFNRNNQPKKAYVFYLLSLLKNKENYKLFSEIRHTHSLPFRIVRSLGFIILSIITLGIFFIGFLYDWHKKTGSLNFFKSRSQAIIDEFEASVQKEDPAAVENIIDRNDNTSKLKAKNIANLKAIEQAISDFKNLCNESNSKLDFNDTNLSKLLELHEIHTVTNFITNFKKLTIEKNNQNFEEFFTIIKNLESFSLPKDNLTLLSVTNTKYDKNIENIFFLAQDLLKKISTFDVFLLTEESVLHLINTKKNPYEKIDIERISETLERIYNKNPEDIKKKEILLEEYDKPVSSPTPSSPEDLQPITPPPPSSSSSPLAIGETLTASSSLSSFSELLTPVTVQEEQPPSTTNYPEAYKTLIQLEKKMGPYLYYAPNAQPALHDNLVILKAIDTLLRGRNSRELITVEMVNFLYQLIKQTPTTEEINLQKLIELHEKVKKHFIIRCILFHDKNEIIHLKNIEDLVDNILVLHQLPLPYPNNIFDRENLGKFFNTNSGRKERPYLFLLFRKFHDGKRDDFINKTILNALLERIQNIGEIYKAIENNSGEAMNCERNDDLIKFINRKVPLRSSASSPQKK